MLQRYIRALVDLSVNVKTYQPSISRTVARDELNNPVPIDCAKKCQQAFLALLLLAFLMPNRIDIPQTHRITAVALHLGVF